MTIQGLLVALLAAGKCIGEPVVSSWAGNRDLSTAVDIRHNAYRPAPSSGLADGLNLLDIVLVAGVDGKLHALNRTSGDFIWSMKTVSGTEPTTLGPLVRTKHPEIDPDLTDDDSIHREVYLVEPQSGDIYIMATPDSPLQRLPFSMPQLVDMSPFSFPSDDDRRMFVGRKETSLLLVELETGRVRTMDQECPWDPFQDLAEPAAFDLDLDDLEGADPPRRPSKPTEVFIGRTGASPHNRCLRSFVVLTSRRLPHRHTHAPVADVVSQAARAEPLVLRVRTQQPGPWYAVRVPAYRRQRIHTTLAQRGDRVVHVRHRAEPRL